MKKLTTWVFDSNYKAIFWLNKSNIPKEDIVSFNTNFFGYCRVIFYADDDIRNRLDLARERLELKIHKDDKFLFTLAVTMVFICVIVFLFLEFF